MSRTDTSDPPRSRRTLAVSAWAAYLVVLLIALLAPSSRIQSDLVWHTHLVLEGLPAVPDSWVSYERLEVVANAFIVAPVSLLGSVVWPRLRWEDWTAFAFVGSLFVEATQGVLLSARQASFSDVVANAAGAMIGAWLYLGLRWLERRRAARAAG